MSITSLSKWNDRPMSGQQLVSSHNCVALDEDYVDLPVLNKKIFFLLDSRLFSSCATSVLCQRKTTLSIFIGGLKVT